MRTNHIVRTAALIGTAVMGLTIALPMAAQARERGDANWYARQQPNSVCVRHKDGYPAGKPWRCHYTGESNRGSSFTFGGRTFNF